MQSMYFLKAHHAGNQYRPVLTQYHQVPPNTIQYCPLLTHHLQVPNITTLAQFYQVPTSTVLHRHCTIKYQPVLPHNEPVAPSTIENRPFLTQNLGLVCECVTSFMRYTQHTLLD